MPTSVTPMIHVPDVRATAAWYQAIGFTVDGWHGCDADGLGEGPPPAEGELDWASLRWGGERVMLSAGGVPASGVRRDVDLYIALDPGPAGEGVDALYRTLKDVVEIVEAPYDAFHGNRELIVRDPNGFWLTFAEPVAARGG